MAHRARSADRLSLIFAALADPTRRAILARLAQGETTVSDLAEPFAMTLPAVSKHLKVLQRAGLIEQGRHAQWRPCKLDAGPLREVANWVTDYRSFWGESFDRMDEYLHQVQRASGTAADE
jgi:DNA-binding transcriptional ArsR family regulator